MCLNKRSQATSKNVGIRIGKLDAPVLRPLPTAIESSSEALGVGYIAD